LRGLALVIQFTALLVTEPALMSFDALAADETPDSKPPDTDQQAALLNKMSEYAEAYTGNVPSFLCIQVTTHYTSGLKHLEWKKGDTVVAQLSYNNGQEQHKIRLVNNKIPRATLPSWHWGLTSAGEFSNQLYNVFAESSKAGYAWNRWDSLRGRRVAVFDYTIQKEHSTMSLSSMGVKAIVAYRGTIWADAETGQVWRIDNHALDIPSELQMLEIGTVTDYASVTIAERSYVLPVHADIQEKDIKEYKKNEVDFTNYQQFRADSTLRFDVPDEPKQQ
jgi:hypothetical protein